MNTNRKVKKAIEIAQFWLNLDVTCEFSDSAKSGYTPWRDIEAYAVMISNPQQSGLSPTLRVIPKDRPLNSLTDVDKENISFNEIHLFKYTMIFQEIEEKQIRMDKESRRQFQQYLADKMAEAGDR